MADRAVLATSWVDVYTLIAFVALLAVVRGMGRQHWKTDAWCAVGVVLWPLALAWLAWSWWRKRPR